ncbi:hypothetical protein [Hellea balneolensis]|uniref:hypothetical protein n=1 Tax=Hellea balneolensis TaxID=287478 RepID=UPI000403ACB6|nr:hypothetical protein [Hellea balneolensis]
MSKYMVQIQPDYHRDGHKLLITFQNKFTLIEDIKSALKPLGNLNIIDGDNLLTRNFDFYITSDAGEFGLALGDERIAQDPMSIYLTRQTSTAPIFRCKSLFKNSSKFNVVEDLMHPTFDPLNLWGQSALAISFLIMGFISIYGDPDFEADIKGLPLGLLASLGSAVLILKFGAVSFFIRRIGEKFPDPLNLNNLAFCYMIAMAFNLFVFL